MIVSLDHYVATERSRAFAWGEGNGDCLLFVLGWIERATGRTSSQAWRGSYDDRDGARLRLARFGGAIAAVTDLLGPPRMGSGSTRGDVGLLETDGWHLGMICTGRMWVLRDGTRGIRFTRMAPDIVWAVR